MDGWISARPLPEGGCIKAGLLRRCAVLLFAR